MKQPGGDRGDAAALGSRLGGEADWPGIPLHPLRRIGLGLPETRRCSRDPMSAAFASRPKRALLQKLNTPQLCRFCAQKIREAWQSALTSPHFRQTGRVR
jgi:hypothetical protein